MYFIHHTQLFNPLRHCSSAHKGVFDAYVQMWYDYGVWCGCLEECGDIKIGGSLII